MSTDSIWTVANLIIVGILAGELMVFLALGILVLIRLYLVLDPKLGWIAASREIREIRGWFDAHSRPDQGAQRQDYRH
jgi:hypothetical protein